MDEASLQPLHPDPMATSPDLTRAIMARTSGNPCHRLHSLACDFVDGALEVELRLLHPVDGLQVHQPLVGVGLGDLGRLLPDGGLAQAAVEDGPGEAEPDLPGEGVGVEGARARVAVGP